MFTWVDGGDPSWRRQFEQWSARWPSDVGADGRDPSRYRDNGELRYALRAIDAYAPWFRRIHVVTAGQRPAWLRDHPRVALVDHADVLGDDCLPTFNSHAIEARLHHVPGLAEHFVYFNDDVFLARPQQPSAFFDDAGRPVVALADAPLPAPETATPATVDLGALRALSLLRRDPTLHLPSRRPSHGPFALRRSVLTELEARFGPALAATARNRFRSSGDVPLPTFLAPVSGLATGAAVRGELDVRYVGVDDEHLDEQLAIFAGDGLDAFCLNDTERVRADSEATAAVRAFLASRYPTRAAWEHRGRPAHGGPERRLVRARPDGR